MLLLPLHGCARLHCSQRARFPYILFCIQQASVMVISLRFAGLMYPLFCFFFLKNLSVDARHYHLILFSFPSCSFPLLIPHLSFSFSFFLPFQRTLSGTFTATGSLFCVSAPDPLRWSEGVECRVSKLLRRHTYDRCLCHTIYMSFILCGPCAVHKGLLSFKKRRSPPVLAEDTNFGGNVSL